MVDISLIMFCRKTLSILNIVRTISTKQHTSTQIMYYTYVCIHYIYRESLLFIPIILLKIHNLVIIINRLHFQIKCTTYLNLNWIIFVVLDHFTPVLYWIVFRVTRNYIFIYIYFYNLQYNTVVQIVIKNIYVNEFVNILDVEWERIGDWG